MNHYQDISVRRVIAELVDDPTWPDVVDTPAETIDLVDLGTGDPPPDAAGPRLPRRPPAPDPRADLARLLPQPGGRAGPRSDADHDPARAGWSGTTREGCGHLSVEAFWQQSKVVEVRYDRFLAAGRRARATPWPGCDRRP